MELEYHEKLKFEELKFLNSDTLLYISEIVVDPKIFYKNVVRSEEHTSELQSP